MIKTHLGITLHNSFINLSYIVSPIYEDSNSASGSKVNGLITVIALLSPPVPVEQSIPTRYGV